MNTRRYRLGELCRMVKGTSPTLKTPPGQYPLVVTASFRRTSDTWQLEGPAVCIPLISSTGHGDAALHRIHYQDGKFALANLLVALLPKDSSVCDAQYLYHFLMTHKDELLVPLMQGTANVSLKEQDIAQVEINLPSLEEQTLAVTQIEQITAQVHQVEELREQEQIEIMQMLTSSFWQITQNAPRHPLKDVAPIMRRPVDVKAASLYPEIGIRSFGNGTFHKPVLTGLEVGSKRIFMIEPGDLLFSNVFAWEGAIAVARPEDTARFGSHRFISCIPDSAKAIANFLCFFFLTDEGLALIGKASPGGAGRNRTLGISTLEKILVPVPDLADQRWFCSLLAKATGLRRLHNETKMELDALLPSVLARAFAGEL